MTNFTQNHTERGKKKKADQNETEFLTYQIGKCFACFCYLITHSVVQECRHMGVIFRDGWVLNHNPLITYIKKKKKLLLFQPAMVALEIHPKEMIRDVTKR